MICSKLIPLALNAFLGLVSVDAAVKHVVVGKWAKFTTVVENAAALECLRDLPALEPEIGAYASGSDMGAASPSPTQAQWGLVAEFASADGFKTYAAKNKSQACLKGNASSMLEVEFQVPESRPANVSKPALLTHILVGQWADGISDKSKAQAIQCLRGMRPSRAGIGSSIYSLQTGTDMAITRGNSDWALVAEFTSTDYFNLYLKSDVRATCMNLLNPLLKKKSSVEFNNFECNDYSPMCKQMYDPLQCMQLAPTCPKTCACCGQPGLPPPYYCHQSARQQELVV